jgi:hypothetical protein
MFEDILGEEKKTQPKRRINLKERGIDLNPSPPLCDNCVHGSNILSNFPDKVLCQKYKRHKRKDYVCRNWEIRK